MVDISRQLSVAKATVMKIWNKTMGLINKTLNDYPLLAYGVSVGKKMLRVAKALSEQLSIESNLRTWVRRVMGRVDALASTIVRIIDVVYHNKGTWPMFSLYLFSFQNNNSCLLTFFLKREDISCFFTI